MNAQTEQKPAGGTPGNSKNSVGDAKPGPAPEAAIVLPVAKDRRCISDRRSETLATSEMLRDAGAAFLYINKMENEHGFVVLSSQDQIFVTRCEKRVVAGTFTEGDYYRLEGVRMAVRTLWGKD